MSPLVLALGGHASSRCRCLLMRMRRTFPDCRWRLRLVAMDRRSTSSRFQLMRFLCKSHELSEGLQLRHAVRVWV
jgi:hypothetical protein